VQRSLAGSLAFACSCVAASVSLRSRKSQEIARSFTTGGRNGTRTEAFVTMEPSASVKRWCQRESHNAVGTA